MSFGRLKTRLRALINRKDLTDQLAGDFILDAMADLERDLRIGPMEMLMERGTWDGVSTVFALPTNFLEMMNLFTDSGELVQVDMNQWLRMEDVGPVPTHFVKIADRYLLKPTPKPGTKVYLHYYGETTRPIADADKNVWSQGCFNATLYTAAALAADFFQIEEADRYAGKAVEFVEKIAGQDLNEKWAGPMSIPAPLNIGDY